MTNVIARFLRIETEDLVKRTFEVKVDEVDYIAEIRLISKPKTDNHCYQVLLYTPNGQKNRYK